MEGRHRMELLLAGETLGLALRLLVVAAVLDEARAQRLHRCVLLGAVSVGHHEGHREPVPPPAKARLCPWLPRVALIRPAVSRGRRLQ